MRVKNVGFMIKNPYGRKKLLTVINGEDSELRFDCQIGCCLYGLKRKKAGRGGQHSGVARCIVMGIDEKTIKVVAFNPISGERVYESAYPLGDVVLFPLPELHSLGEDDIKALNDGTGFPASISVKNFPIGQMRAEYIRNLYKFSPMVEEIGE